MENLQVPKLIKKKIVFAFPGMGKTPYCKTHAACIDADFGFFREGMDVRKEDEAPLVLPWAKVCKLWLRDGFTVFVNEPKLLRNLDGSSCLMFLPSDPTYSARKMKTTVDTVKEWIAGWHAKGRAKGIPVIYIDEGLDTYLS